jgi:hypothetical protein
MPLFYYCVRIVLFILFASIIRSKLLVRHPLLPPLPPMPHSAFQTPPQLPLLLHLIQQHLLCLMLINSLSSPSWPLHHPVFLLLHLLFSNHKCRACLNENCLSNQLLIPFSHSANKITASFETDSLIGLLVLANYALINSYLFLPVISISHCLYYLFHNTICHHS